MFLKRFLQSFWLEGVHIEDKHLLQSNSNSVTITVWLVQHYSHDSELSFL